MKKRFVSVMLASTLVMGLVLSGCGSKETPAEEVPPVETESTEGTEEAGEDTADADTKQADKIIIFQSKVEIIDQLEACAEEYTEQTGVEVEVWGTTGDDYLQQLKTKLSNNQGPTIFSLAPGSESVELKNYLAPLDDLSIVGNIASGMADNIDGKTVGIPYTLEGFGVVYNNSLIDPTKVTDKDAFVNMLKEQKEAGINGFTLSQESYFLIGHILNTPFALQADPEAYVNDLIAGNVKMQDTPEFQEFAEIMEAVREYTPNPLEINYDKETGDFATGKSASIHQGNWCYGMFADYDVDFDMGIMPLPLKGNDKIAVSVPACWYVSSQAADGEVAEAKKFIEWLYTSETGERYLLEEFGFIPVVSTMESESLDPLSQSVADAAAEGKTIGWAMNAYWPSGIVDVYLVPVVQEFFTTNMSGTEFLEKLTEAFVEAGK